MTPNEAIRRIIDHIETHFKKRAICDSYIGSIIHGV